MKSPSVTVKAFVFGCLLSILMVGSVPIWQYLVWQSEKTVLSEKIATLQKRNRTLHQRRRELEEELTALETQREHGYDANIQALMAAKDQADLHALYEVGLQAFKAKDYPNAYFALKQVHQSQAQYKEMPIQFPLVQAAYQQHQKQMREHELSTTYAQALDLQLKGQFAQAKLHYQRILALQSTYKDTPQRLQSVSQQLSTLQQHQELKQKEQWLAATFQIAVKAQGMGRYAQAESAYQQILDYAPIYKDTARRLKIVKAQLPVSLPSRSEINCFKQGVALAKCAKGGDLSHNCSPSELATLATCKSHPDFQRGLQSIKGREAEENLSLLKGFPDWLKGL